MVSRLSIGDHSRFIHETARTVRGKAIHTEMMKAE
jgi:hypothetical protein